MFIVLLSLALTAGQASPPPEVVSVTEVDSAWTGCAVSYDFVRSDGRQYIAYYDGERRLSVASRPVGGEAPFEIVKLDELIGWDSHNYPSLGIDPSGRLHLAANMHGHPLNYFRTREPHDISTFERIDRMTGERERGVTYPTFVTNADGDLVFRYRDGGSGNGADLYNIWNDKASEWSRLLEKPLHDGLGRMNAYCSVPELGPDGFFHIHWVWRDTPMAETNHDLSHARSRDLVHWETMAGDPVALPLTIETPGLVVDPIPAEGGLLNGAPRLGFDSADRPLLAYYKFDDEGSTEAHVARGEKSGEWSIHKLTDWNHRYWFEGGGSLPPGDVHLGRPVAETDGRIILPVSHRVHGAKRLVLDGESLEVIDKLPPLQQRPAGWTATRSGVEGVNVRWRSEKGAPGGENTTFVARWEALPSNRDQPRDSVPPPSTLQILEVSVPSSGRAAGDQRNEH